MRFLIIPFVGAGKIKFGMTPEQVRLLLGGVFDSFCSHVITLRI